MGGIFATTRPDMWRMHRRDVRRLLRHRGRDADETWGPEGEVLLCQAHWPTSEPGLGATPAPGSLMGQAVAVDGRIYNVQEPANGLGPGSTMPDARAIVGHVTRDGLLAAAGRFRGMYAIVHWDPVSRSLSAVRDPWGIKPLYLLDHPAGGVTLCSEMGPLLLHADAREVDPIGLAQYVAFGHTLPQFTSRLRIRKLSPGAVHTWSLVQRHQVDLSIRRVVRPAPGEQTPLADAVMDSVRAHVGGAPDVGVLLEGGDGDALLAAAAAETGAKVRTFAASYPDAGDGTAARRPAPGPTTVGAHAIVPITTADMLAALDRLLETLGEPFGDPTALRVPCLAERAADHGGVVLSGVGAEVALGTSARYPVSSILPRHGVPGLNHVLRGLAGRIYDRRGDELHGRAVEAVLRFDGGRSHAALMGADLPAIIGVTPLGAEVDTLLRTDWEGFTDGKRGHQAARWFDLGRWLPNTHLETTDRASMAVGVEVRTPYIDPAVVAAAEAPDRGLRTNALHRAPGGRLAAPRRVGQRRLVAVPIRNLLASELSDDLARVLHSRDSVLHNALGAVAVGTLARRACHSEVTAFRLAVLGRWEASADVA